MRPPHSGRLPGRKRITRQSARLGLATGAALSAALLAGCGSAPTSAPSASADPTEYELLSAAERTVPGYRKCYFDAWPCVRVDEVIGFVAPPARESAYAAISACLDVWVSRTNGAFGSPGQPPTTPTDTSATGKLKRQQVCGYFDRSAAKGLWFQVGESSPDMFTQARDLGEKLCAPIPKCENAVIDSYAASNGTEVGPTR